MIFNFRFIVVAKQQQILFLFIVVVVVAKQLQLLQFKIMGGGSKSENQMLPGVWRV